MADWVTISSLATAGGTLVLAGATFASMRSANGAGQRVVASRCVLTQRQDSGWIAAVARHWNVDSPDPR